MKWAEATMEATTKTWTTTAPKMKAKTIMENSSPQFRSSKRLHPLLIKQTLHSVLQILELHNDSYFQLNNYIRNSV